MTSALTYIVDDQDPSIEYLCPVVKEVHLRSYFNDTWTTIASPDCGGGWFRYKFNGTSVRIAASASRITQNFTVQIDGSPLLIQSGNGLYQSPNLLDGEHTVLYAVSDPSIYPSFDYLSVTSTSVVGRNIIMDDTDGAIKYSGNWSPNPATGPVSFDYSTMPYLNTTHWSNTVGDSFSFQFSGDSVAIYGVLLSQSNETVSGNLTATYSVDGKTSALALPTGASWNNPMSRLFSVDLPDSGSHTVVVNVTSVTGKQALGFDFMTYNTSTTASFISSNSSTDVRTIVGCVLGGILGLLAITLMLALWRRKRQLAKARVLASLRPRFIASWAWDSRQIVDPEESQMDTKLRPLI